MTHEKHNSKPCSKPPSPMTYGGQCYQSSLEKNPGFLPEKTQKNPKSSKNNYMCVCVCARVYVCVCAGTSIPSEAMVHFSPFSDFILFPKNFLTPWKISQILPEICFYFSSAKISDNIFFINPNCRILPLFSRFQFISPYFDKIILSPYF